MAGIELCKFTHGLGLYILRSYPERLAGIELCKFTHGLGLYILRFYPSLSLGVKFEYKTPAHV
jgi:hypothetical protein